MAPQQARVHGGKATNTPDSSPHVASHHATKSSLYARHWYQARGVKTLLLCLSALAVVGAIETPNVERVITANGPLNLTPEQYAVPIVAGVPPPGTETEHDKQKEQEYIQRLELDRVQRQGSFYTELTDKELGEGATSGVVRYSKEPLPWEAMSENDDMDGTETQWHSPWRDQGRFEALANKDSHGIKNKVDRPRLDQIDLLGHEAEVDWLDEQERVRRAQKKKHHHLHDKHKDKGHNHDEDIQDGGDRGIDIDTRMSANSLEVDKSDVEDSHERTPTTPEEVFHDPQWHANHGGLNPKHFDPSNHKHSDSITPMSKSRVEKQDRDEDGTVFPDIHSGQPYSKIVYPSIPGDPKSPLGYVAYNRQGDRIMDFSMVGWNEGNTELPDASKDVPVTERLSPRPGADSDSDKGDDTDRIQSALDRVSQSTERLLQGNGVVPLGSLVLERGVYRISRPLKIQHSGLLFRGDPAGGSRIVCQWKPTGPRYAIEVEGRKDQMLDDTNIPVVSDYTPVGSFNLALDPTYIDEVGLTIGDQVVVTRIGNDRWVEDIGMDDFDTDKKGVKPWKKMRGRMYRTIRGVNPRTGIVRLDAPLPISIQRRYGGGFVTKYRDRKIRALGIQFLDMVFPKNVGRTTDEMLDDKGRGSQDYRFSYEIFANYALRVDRACHMYISHVTSAYFHNFVSLGTDVHHVTLDSIVHSYPDEMLSGQSAFQLSGQLVLIKNSLSQGSFHFFVDINHIMGPTVFHRLQATNVGKPHRGMPLDFAPGEVGPHMKFCTGILVDQTVTDGSIQIVDRGDMGTGQGYAGANSVVWNSRAREGILTHRAKGFQNFVIGSENFDAEDRQPWDSHGWKEHLGSEVHPGSLYLRQLGDRLDRLSKGWVA